MTGRPDVSVIIPTRDALAWLPSAIASIGTDARVEILVVDDGSTDGTLCWLGQQAAVDARIRFLHGAHAGLSRARNLGISAANAPLIAFLNADDRWLPEKLDRQLALHRAHPEIGFSFSACRHVTADRQADSRCCQAWQHFAGRYVKTGQPAVIEHPVAALYAHNVVPISTVVARTDLLQDAGGFSTELRSAEDWDLWLRLATRAPVGVVPAVLAEEMTHRAGKLTARTDLRVAAMHIIAERYRDSAVRDDPAAHEVFTTRLLTTRAEAARAAGQPLSAAMLHLRALLREPSWPGVRRLCATLLPRPTRV